MVTIDGFQVDIAGLYKPITFLLPELHRLASMTWNEVDIHSPRLEICAQPKMLRRSDALSENPCRCIVARHLEHGVNAGKGFNRPGSDHDPAPRFCAMRHCSHHAGSLSGQSSPHVRKRFRAPRNVAHSEPATSSCEKNTSLINLSTTSRSISMRGAVVIVIGMVLVLGRLVTV
jgi:hypothetical protein